MMSFFCRFRGRGGYYNRGPSNYRGNNYRGNNNNGNFRSIRGGGQQRSHQNGPQNNGPRTNSQPQQPTVAAVVAGEGNLLFFLHSL